MEMSSWRAYRRGPDPGFSLAELLVFCTIVGILMMLAVPAFLSYFDTAAVRAAADEVVAFLNQGRQLAIRLNSPVCVGSDGPGLHFRVGSCAGALWTGPGTDAAGNLRLPQGTMVAAAADPVFSSLGAAVPGATYTVTRSGQSLSVVVAASGRVTVAP